MVCGRSGLLFPGSLVSLQWRCTYYFISFAFNWCNANIKLSEVIIVAITSHGIDLPPPFLYQEHNGFPLLLYRWAKVGWRHPLHQGGHEQAHVLERSVISWPLSACVPCRLLVDLRCCLGMQLVYGHLAAADSTAVLLCEAIVSFLLGWILLVVLFFLCFLVSF